MSSDYKRTSQPLAEVSAFITGDLRVHAGLYQKFQLLSNFKFISCTIPTKFNKRLFALFA